jgi:hypothetical protein
MEEYQLEPVFMSPDPGLALRPAPTRSISRLQEAKISYRVLYGAFHEDTLWVESEWAWAMFCSLDNGYEPLLGDCAEVEELRAELYRILNVREENLGLTHPDSICSPARIAWFHYRIKEYEVAVGFKRAVTECKFGFAYIYHAECLMGLARCYFRLPQPTEITVFSLDMAWEACRVAFGEDHVHTEELALLRQVFPRSTHKNRPLLR